jgi:hypothetical protein
MAASPSLTLDDLRALLSLLEYQDTLTPALQTVASKLLLQAQALGFPPGAESFLLNSTSTPIQEHSSFQSEDVGTLQSQAVHSLPLTIRIPARRPRSPASDRNENRHDANNSDL